MSTSVQAYSTMAPIGYSSSEASSLSDPGQSKAQELLATRKDLISFNNRIRKEVRRIQNDPQLSQGQKNGEIAMLERQYDRNQERIKQINAELVGLGYSEPYNNSNSGSSSGGIDSLGRGYLP